MSDRIRVLDAARGFAVLGLLYAHFPSTGGSALVFDDPALLGWSPLSAGLWAVEAVWVDGVMRGVFATLFGASMAILLAKPGGLAANRLAFVWRCVGLFGLGLVHVCLLAWAPDILAIYALAGLGVLVVSGLPPRVLMGLGLTALGLVVAYAFHRDIAVIRPDLPAWTADQAAHAAGYRAQLGTSLAQWWTSVSHPAVLERVCEAGGYMLLGLGLMRAGALGLGDRVLWRVALWGAGIGSALGLSAVALDLAQGLRFDVMLHPLMRAGKPALVLAVLAGFALALRRPGLARLAGAVFEPVGRMALSAYMASSAVMLVLFTGAGLGLYGAFDRVQLWALATLIAVQIVLACRIWTTQLGQGPMERVLRNIVQRGVALTRSRPLVRPPAE